jgi:hypothetical protein
MEGGVAVPDEVRGWLARGAPGLLLAGSALLAVLLGIPAVPLAALAGLLLLTPTARSIASRIMLATIGTFALAAITVNLTGLAWGVAERAVLVLALLVLHWVVAFRIRPNAPLVPQIRSIDWLVAGGASLIVGMLGLPYLRGSADDILLDLARGFDPVNHMLMLANLTESGGGGWTALDGNAADPSAPVYVEYPHGFHAVIAGLLDLGGLVEGRASVLALAGSTLALLGLCAAILLWIAGSVAEELGQPASRRGRSGAAVMALTACGVLGGSFGGPFELGHGQALVLAGVAIATSWLVLRPRQRALAPATAMGTLSVGAIGLAGGYPPYAVAVVPAAGWVVLGLVRSNPALGLALAGLGAAITAWLFWAWRSQLEFLALATGEHATPIALSFVMVALTGFGVLAARSMPGWAAAGAALAAPMGLMGGALLIAAAAVALGGAADASYYAAKAAEAGWLGALPVLVALVAAGLDVVAVGRAPVRRWVVLGGGLVGCVLLVGLLPVGRGGFGLAGPQLLTQRMLEADRARGLVQVTGAARLAGPSAGDASGMVEPSGWFFKVAKEDAPADEWVRQAVSASLWMASLRGIRTNAVDEAAHCFRERGDASAIPCLEAWLTADPERTITIAVGTTPAVQAFDAWARGFPDRVRLVRLPAPGR